MNTIQVIPSPSYVYEAKVLKYHDGDTFRALLRLGVDCDRECAIRVYGVNSPELGTKAQPNPAGIAAQQFTNDWLKVALASGNEWPLIVDSKGYDKYGGRVNGIVYRKSDGHNLASDLVAAGHAVVKQY